MVSRASKIIAISSAIYSCIPYDNTHPNSMIYIASLLILVAAAILINYKVI